MCFCLHRLQRRFLLSSVGVFGALLLTALSPRAESLEGEWRLALDLQDVGIAERWFERRLEQPVRLPGSLPQQQIGEQVTVETKWTGSIVDQSYFTAPEYAPYRVPGNVKVPFWLQPERYYAGVAWYQRELKIPAAWAGQRAVLSLERPHWETRVWVDGQCLGTNRSLSTPHDYDLGTLPPGPHRLTIRVDNRLVVDIGRDSHSVSDHTQGNWNGIVGQVTCRPRPLVWIDDLQVFAHPGTGKVNVRGLIGNVTGTAGSGEIRLAIRTLSKGRPGSRNPIAETACTATWKPAGGAFACEVEVANPRLWDEFSPELYQAEAVLRVSGRSDDRATVPFGFRDWVAEGRQFQINGRKTFVRGTLECCIFPKTGHPPMDVAAWRRVIRTAKAHGLNNLRFHSWCPPEAAFQAADELGLYLHVECASWANASTTLGDGKPVDQWVNEETDRILRAYGNHPSFAMLLYGNEPGGDHPGKFLAEWVNRLRKADGRRLYSSGAGWPQLPENQFHVTPDPRIQSWGGGLKSRINALPPETTTDYREYIRQRPVPVISHEIGQWCVYPNFDEIPKYTGYLKPRNFEVFRQTLQAHHMGDQARAFLLASGKLQALCYKEEIEAALRTPDMGGFQLLDLHDFPGQGTALVGVLDPFWESKGYITPAAFHRFCGPTVPLARFSKRVFTQDEEADIGVEVAHFGPERLPEARLVYQFVNDRGDVFARGRTGPCAIEPGNGQAASRVQVAMRQLPAPARYRFELGLAPSTRSDRLLCENDWDIWVYPPVAPAEPPEGVTVVHEMNEAAGRVLDAGGKVLWLVPPAQVPPDKQLGKVELGFSSIFWNTAWTRRQAPHTLGILCDQKRPLFAEFPTDNYSNWQWWYLIHRAGPLILDDLPAALRPDVQVIDDWFTARKLGIVFEAKVEKGQLLVCSIELENDLAADPVARQFRRSLFRYMASPHFRPRISVTAEQLRTLTPRR